MGVSTINGTIEEAVLGASRRHIRIYSAIRFRLRDGASKTVTKARVHQQVADLLRPGTSGRFYLYTAAGSRGIHGVRDDSGREAFHFPASETGFLIMIPLMALMVPLSLATRNSLSLLLGIVVLVLSVPSYFITRSARVAAQRQFETDRRPAPMPASASVEPALGA